MHRSISLIILLALVFFDKGKAQVQIVPYPNQIDYLEGNFFLNNRIKINVAEGLEGEADFLKEIIENKLSKKIKTNSKSNKIILSLNLNRKNELGNEGYQLDIKDKSIHIEGATSIGVYYGIQTFRQILMQKEIESGKKEVQLPRLQIIDKPQFKWRSFMLDESRHFKGIQVVKNLLDQMALLKMNVFHWHLTDDQGWRIEIHKYPLLTEIGSKRKDTQTERKGDGRTGKPHHGFYTQNEIKDIIAYAKDRKITVVPEIEMPGHATAAIAAYPWVGSLSSTKEVSVTFGKMDDSFNIADPEVVSFLKDILDEVIDLFPDKVIHIGGDEVNFDTWENSKSVKAFMEKKGLETPVDLQIYFTNEISNYIESKGKKMMGWNDILGGDIHEKRVKASPQKTGKLARNSIIHFWKGDLDLIDKAITEGYSVVNSHHWDTYLDYTYKVLPLSKAYNFNPLPEGLNPQYKDKLLGAGAQLWSEWIPTVKKMEYQVFPRLAAYAETGWTKKKNKDYKRFIKSLNMLEQYWDKMDIQYHAIEKQEAEDNK